MKPTHSLSINNTRGLKVLMITSMIFVGIMLANAILTNRYIGSNTYFILGGTLTSPFIFILDDIVSEIYGYKVARAMIISGFFAQTLFVLICQAVVIAPHPDFFQDTAAYQKILGLSLLQINFSGCFAYLVANLVNSYVLARWKFLLKGRKFWLRSLGSSTFSEALYTLIAITLMEIREISLEHILEIVLISFSIKAIYSCIFAFPTQLLVNFLKRFTGIDVFDLPARFTPSNLLAHLGKAQHEF